MAGTDYRTVTGVGMTIAAGAASGTRTFTLTPINDDIFEGNETISVEGSVAGGAVTVTPATITITDDDTESTALEVTLTPTSARESAGTAMAEVIVSLDEGTRTSDTEVMLTVLDDEATSPADYSVTGSPFTLTIDAGMTSVSQAVPIVIVDDDIFGTYIPKCRRGLTFNKSLSYHGRR